LSLLIRPSKDGCRNCATTPVDEFGIADSKFNFLAISQVDAWGKPTDPIEQGWRSPSAISPLATGQSIDGFFLMALISVEIPVNYEGQFNSNI
jgi:hypothetical protein